MFGMAKLMEMGTTLNIRMKKGQANFWQFYVNMV